MADEPTGFLGRWARRKEEARQGKALDEPAAASAPAGSVPPAAPTAPVQPQPAAAAAPAPADDQAPKVLTLDDARLLTRDSDFKPFMAGNVSPEVRNAAMKKLFADPHFNVMDGLDTYIDDYSKFEPIPESMLRQMASAKFLKLFDEEEEKEKDEDKKGAAHDAAAPPRESANNPTDETVAQSSYENPDIAPPEPAGPAQTSQPAPPVAGSQPDHAHTDLRLQPDHAAPAPGAGRGPQ
ncbi:Protein of unknown function (DUF3306) [Polaromonas sp. CF318]|uniref:DUF3306 domain-containing protein n=1 Tax=Polaromonas sp. CF318 TaxID=1144318 RepID=UPI0002713D8A|nr:DUF3306 domain-containing protein [Polaromonas sp. CF318]EJL79093.1 Protein of unknown function (DUF3306) [Polaromonas sp. CF318]